MDELEGLELRLNYGLIRSRLRSGLLTSIESAASTSLLLLVSSGFFLVAVASTNPGYSAQMLTSGITNWPTALNNRLYALIVTSGTLGVFLTGLLSVLTGVLVVNSLKGLRSSGFNFDSLAALPGVAASGCASCGVGALSLVGMGGALAAAPFQGNGIRAAAVLLITGLLIRRGDPTTCNVGKVVETG